MDGDTDLQSASFKAAARQKKHPASQYFAPLPPPCDTPPLSMEGYTALASTRSYTLEVELREGSCLLKHIEHEPIDKRDFFEPIETP